MWELKLIGTILAMEVMFVGSNTLTKAATAKGMSNYVYITYTHAIALLILLPKNSNSTSTNWMLYKFADIPACHPQFVFVWSFSFSIFFYTGLRYSSPTVASAISNLSLAFTFIIAIIFRMEILNLRSQSSILKLIGTIVSISGAFIVVFYQGIPITSIFSSPIKPSLYSLMQLQEAQPNWLVGGTFLSMSCLVISIIYVTKTWIASDYPSAVLITLIAFFFETIIASIATLILENDASVWIPTNGIELIAILFGAMTVGSLYTADTWVCRVKGPVFIAMFHPLQMVIAVFMGAIFLGDVLHLGSVIGGLIIAIGFYTLIKGKADEEMPKKDDEIKNRLSCSIEEESHSLKIPMLHDKSMDV